MLMAGRSKADALREAKLAVLLGPAEPILEGDGPERTGRPSRPDRAAQWAVYILAGDRW